MHLQSRRPEFCFWHFGCLCFATSHTGKYIYNMSACYQDVFSQSVFLLVALFFKKWKKLSYKLQLCVLGGKKEKKTHTSKLIYNSAEVYQLLFNWYYRPCSEIRMFYSPMCEYAVWSFSNWFALPIPFDVSFFTIFHNLCSFLMNRVVRTGMSKYNWQLTLGARCSL